MPTRLFANNAVATLSAGISASDTTATLLPSGVGNALFPSLTGGDTFVLTLTQAGVESSWEDVLVTARAGDVVTFTRAYTGTAAIWPSGAKAEIRVTAEAIQNGANALAPDGSGNVYANVVHRTGTLASLLALAGGNGEISCATDADAMVKHNGTAGQAKAFYSGGGLILYNNTAVTADTITCDGYAELILNASAPVTLDVVLPQSPSNGSRFTFRLHTALAAACTISFWANTGKTVAADVVKFPATTPAVMVFEYSSYLALWYCIDASSGAYINQLSSEVFPAFATFSGVALTSGTVANLGNLTIVPPFVAQNGGSGGSYMIFANISFVLGTGAIMSIGGACLTSSTSDYSTNNINKPHVTVQGPPVNTTDSIECQLICRMPGVATGGSMKYLNAKATFTGGTVTASGYAYWFKVR